MHGCSPVMCQHGYCNVYFMEQINPGDLALAPMDYANGNIPDSVKEFKPTVYPDDEAFCCTLGPNRQGDHFITMSCYIVCNNGKNN